MSNHSEPKTPTAPAAPLPSLTDADLAQVVGGIGRPPAYTLERTRRRRGA